MTRNHLAKDAFVGLAGLIILSLVVWLCLALYPQSFVSFETVTVKANRSGLLMDPGADVKLHGVVVGRVGKVVADEKGATLQLKIDPEKLKDIPADSKVNIVPPTVFGAKYVELLTSTAPGGPAIQAGSTIAGARVTVEINHTFDAARQALDNLEPVKLNAALTATADMLDGQGEHLGQLVQASNQLTGSLIDQVPNLGASAKGADQVASAYTPATDSFVATALSASNVIRNLNAREAELRVALQSISSISMFLSTFLRTNETGLGAMTTVLLPVAMLLSKYAPEYNCVLKGVAYNDELLSAIMGGPEFGGTHRNAHVTFMAQRSLPAYKYPDNLPKVAAASGPNCAGLPRVNGFAPYFKYDTGADAYPSKQDTTTLNNVPLDLILFGQQIPNPSGGAK